MVDFPFFELLARFMQIPTWFNKERIMRVAIASSNGQWVDQHFGQSQAFYIYDIENGMAISLGKRLVRPEGSHHTVAAGNLSDCDIAYIEKMGETPGLLFLAAGIRIEQGHRAVSEVLQDLCGDEYPIFTESSRETVLPTGAIRQGFWQEMPGPL